MKLKLIARPIPGRSDYADLKEKLLATLGTTKALVITLEEGDNAKRLQNVLAHFARRRGLTLHTVGVRQALKSGQFSAWVTQPEKAAPAPPEGEAT